ncbi:MAG: DUF1552 domain-containing protein [Proteobacteria bacterium]|nr:MAG: DUF1552 domain-containing protein [Pseudomonadota bacterium]
MLTRKGHARRQLLMSSANSAFLFLPLMRMFRDSEALAADASPAPNVIFTYYPLGFKEKSRVFKGNDGPITEFSQIHKPIEDAGLKDDFLLIDGLYFLGSRNHNGGQTNVLAGWGHADGKTAPIYGNWYNSAGIDGANEVQLSDLEDNKPYSLDQRLAAKWGVPAMGFGTKTGQEFCQFPEALSFKEGNRMRPEDNPQTSFMNFFGNFKSNNSGSTEQKANEAKAIAAELRVIEFLKGDIKRIENNLGSEDKAAFAAHVAALDEINSQINTSIKSGSSTGEDLLASCSIDKIKADAAAANGWWKDEDKLGDVMAINRAMIVQALACRLTRVALFQVGTGHSYSQLRAKGISRKTGDYHVMSHGDVSPSHVADFAEIQTGLVKEIAQIAVDLKNTKVGSSNLFENTLIFNSSEGGNDSGHSSNDIPVFMLGRLGGKINSGQKIRRNVPYNRVLVTVANALGETDIQVVGNKTDKAKGKLDGVIK